MKFELVPSSPLVKVEVESGLAKLPIAELTVGMSITLPVESVVESKLRTFVSRKCKQLGFRCRVLKHSQPAVFEIARIE